LQYSTSEIMTNATIAQRDVAVLYGDKGTDGETVLRYAKAPTVTSTGGAVSTTWDPATGDLRLNYAHSGLIRVQISGAGNGVAPLLLLLADTDTAKTFWRQDTAAGPVLVRGTHLLRGAVSTGSSLALTGDNADDNSLEVFSGAASVTWNGKKVQTQVSSSGSRVGVIGLAAPIVLPALTNWKHTAETPEAAVNFDDSTWQVADKTTSNSITTPGTLPVLFADDYGFHTGNTWYRGRFVSTGKETGITLSAQSGGGAAASSVWLNGTFLGSSTVDGQKTYPFPAGTLKAKGDNIISVLTVNMGHEEDYNSSSGNKAARGLTAAGLVGSPLNTITWRLQGDRGGEDILDTVRGPLNTGGLYGERAGYTLPGYPTTGWKSVSLPAKNTTPGVSWYQTDVTLNLPKGQDTSLGLTITDDPSRKYRAEIFVNGWQMGNYVNYVGPQHSFPVPNGVLNPNGRNDIVIAVWNLDDTSGGLGQVALTTYGSYSSSLTVAQNVATRYVKSVYAMPAAPASSLTLQVPPTVSAGQQFIATAVVSVPKGKSAAQGVSAILTVPAGWTASPRSTPTGLAKIPGGSSAKFTWTVTAPTVVPPVNALVATAHLVQSGRSVALRDERIIGSIPAPPPSGIDPVSDLPFLSATNGWGPVERDQSNGENKPNDGKPITMRGTVYVKGLGTNSPSDIQLYLAGGCSRFTATVGVDDEVGNAATVTFSVILDGTVLTTTPVLKGGGATADIDVPVTGGQVLELVVADGGDGNGNDHADWAIPTLTCR
jgi:hypothetical protein